MSEREEAALKAYRETVDQAWETYREAETRIEIARREAVAQAWKTYAEVMARVDKEAKG